MKLPYSRQVEKHFLASLIKNSDLVPEYLDHLNDSLFYLGIHKTIAQAIKSQFRVHKEVNVLLVSEFISNAGLKSQDDVDVPEYVATIVARNAYIEPSEIEAVFKECYKYQIARAGISQCESTKKKILGAINGSARDVIEAAETGSTLAATSYIDEEFTPVDVYANMAETVEDSAEQGAAIGINTPFKTWNRWWGPLTKGDLTVIAAPAKAGKSTILNYIADVPFCNYNKGKNIKVLVLDTELETYRVQTRKSAALSQVNEYFIKSGKWQRNSEMVEKLQKSFETMKQREGKVFHQYVANVPIDQICSIVRRWRATQTEPDDECLIIYDYLKITDEKINDSHKEYQVLGKKCDTLKHLMSEVGASGLAAIQTNASLDVAASQRIKWFASNVLLFYPKEPDVLAEQGDKFGTHVLTPFVLRNLGPDWLDEEYVKEQTAAGMTWTRNELFLKIENFALTECGTLKDFTETMDQQIEVEDDFLGDSEANRKIKMEEIDLS